MNAKRHKRKSEPDKKFYVIYDLHDWPVAIGRKVDIMRQMNWELGTFVVNKSRSHNNAKNKRWHFEIVPDEEEDNEDNED